MSRPISIDIRPVKRTRKAHVSIYCGGAAAYLGCLDANGRARMIRMFRTAADELEALWNDKADEAMSGGK
ncbi:MAG: hypothetical protein WC763_07035 [Candidatus Paceibacterota bacterium]|jgi:hypothetical protein